MSLDISQISMIINDLKVDVDVLKYRQNNLMKRIKSSIETNKIKNIKNLLNK